MNNPRERVARIFLLQIVSGAALTMTLAVVLSGGWSLWGVFALVYGIALSLAVLFLSRTPRWLWPRRYRFRDAYGVTIAGLMSLLIPFAFYLVINSTTPPTACGADVCTIEVLLVFPSNVVFPLFSIVLPMLGLQSFFGSIAYLVATRLLVLKSAIEIRTDPLSFRFARSLLKSMGEFLLVFNLAITTVGFWLLRGDLITTLSLIVLLQFLLPLYVIALAYRKSLGRKLQWTWKLLLVLGLLLSLALDALLPEATSILKLIFQPADWRSPVLASLTAATLWGMSVARAYVLPD